MLRCAKCGKEAEFCFKVMKVETLRVRDITGEKRVQSVGAFEKISACRECAMERLVVVRKGVRLKKILPYICVFAFGAVLTVMFWSANGAFRLLGLAGIACGIMGSISTVQTEKRLAGEYRKLTMDEQLQRAAWETAKGAVPKKNGDNDVTYIPVTEATLRLKNGDLMIIYDLLPAIAKQAWEILHGEDK